MNLFEVENYKLGQIIFNENDSVENIFFIKEGRVKLIINKSILDIHFLINTIEELVKKKKLDTKNKEKNECNFLGNNFNDNTNNNSIGEKAYYDELNNSVENLKKEINIKQKCHLITYQENQCLGFESLYYGLNYLYTAVSNSDKVEIYKISKERLIKIFQEKNEISYLDFSKKAEKLILFLNKRFININNYMLKFYDKKKTIENEKTFSLNNSHDFINNRYILSEEKKNSKLKLIAIKNQINYKLLPNLIKKIKIINKLNNNKFNDINNKSFNLGKLSSLKLINKKKFHYNSFSKDISENNNIKANISVFKKKNNINIKNNRKNIPEKIKIINLKNQNNNIFELTNLYPPFISYNEDYNIKKNDRIDNLSSKKISDSSNNNEKNIKNKVINKNVSD